MQEALLSVLFWDTFLALVWLWTTVFFFSLLEIHCQCLVMCSSNVGTGKSPDLSDFHPCRSRQSLAIAQVSRRFDLSSTRATLKRNNLSHAGEKMLVSIIKSQNGAASVWFKNIKKKKTKKERKEKKVRVLRESRIFEAGSVHRWVGCVSPRSVRQIYKSRSQPKKTNQLQNRNRNKTLVHLTIFFTLL